MVDIHIAVLIMCKNEKKRIYAQEGINEYWVADINSRHVHIFLNPKNSDYQITQIISDGIIQSQAFPNLNLSIKHLFLW